MMADEMDLDPIDDILCAAAENPAQRYAFYRSLLEHEVIVIGTVSDDSNLNLKYVVTEEGQSVLPVYSSWHKFQSIYGSKFPYIKIPAYMLLDAVALNDPWVLNPGFVPSKLIIPEELQALKDRKILDYYWERLGDKERRAMLEERLAEIPEQAMHGLIQCIRTVPSVRRAYVTTLYRPSSVENAFPLVGLELDDSDRETASELVHTIFESVQEQWQMDPPFEFIVLEEATPLAKSMREQLQPIYVRTTIEDIRSMFR
ncbi:MAG: enhanced serine sensitivity protein SseB C-terminal domain-containing protein [Cohnella sp.]|nr:enhanced serine sensitivity protein SseB C-terminal domain-containing protein [Cohnella sp.]